MPFGKFKDFADCVSKNKDKDSPESYCAQIHKDITGKWPSEKEKCNCEVDNMREGKINGPRIPDGTGPMSGTDECPLKTEEIPFEEPKPEPKYKIQVKYFDGNKWVDRDTAVDEDEATKLFFKHKGAGKTPRIVDAKTGETCMEHLNHNTVTFAPIEEQDVGVEPHKY